MSLFWKQLLWWSCLGLVAGVIWLVHAFSVDDMKSPNAASWVQAVGSVFAILAAVAVAAFQHWQDREREARAAREERKRVISLIRGCAEQLLFIIENEGGRAHRRTGLAKLMSLPDYSHTKRQLDMLQLAVNSFEASQMPTTEAFFSLHTLRSHMERVQWCVRDPATILDIAEKEATAPNWAMFRGHVKDLIGRLDFEIRHIDDPSAEPPWA